jgi:hypothetical protein
MPRFPREVLQGDVFELRALADEELGRLVRVRMQVRGRGDDLLDEREARSGIGDHEQPPEERRLVGGARDAHVQRLVELHVLGDVDEQAVLPHRRVVRGELLVPADERVEALVPFVEPLERDPVGRALDRDAALGDRREPRDVEVEHRLGRTCPGSDPGRVRNASGSKARRSVKRQCSSVVSGSGSSW